MARLQVFYDGGCPICSREIAFYQKRPAARDFEWIDVNQCDAELGPGLTAAAAMARMHVRTQSGVLLSGAAAFGEMWRQMPGFKALGWLLAVPPFAMVAEWGYRGFLLARKVWR